MTLKSPFDYYPLLTLLDVFSPVEPPVEPPAGVPPLPPPVVPLSLDDPLSGERERVETGRRAGDDTPQQGRRVEAL